MDNDGGGKWIPVGKVPKTKAQKEAAFKKLPKLKDLGRTSSLLYDDLDAGDSEPLQDMSNIPNQSVTKSSKQTTKKKSKKAAPESKYDFKTFESAITAAQDDDSLVEPILKLKERFSDKPTVWPKEVAAHLNSVLKCPDENPTFAGKPFDYPMCKAPKALRDVLMTLFGKELSEPMIPLMFHHCLNGMLDYIARDTQTWGFRLCLQALAHTHPNLCLEEVEKYNDKMTSTHHAPKISLSLLWALGQAGVKSPKCGVKVWFQVMFPHLHIKPVSQYAMQYIETILSRCKSPANDLKGSVTAEHYLAVARWAFDNSGTIKHASAIQFKMQNIYPTFRALAIDTKARRRKVFTVLLKTSDKESAKLKRELTSVAIDCLRDEPSCFKLWRDSYVDVWYRTKLLLTDMSERWQIVVKDMPEQEFKETMQAFHNINSDMAAQSDPLTGKPEFREMRLLCEGINEQLADPVMKPNPLITPVVIGTFIALFALGVCHVYTDIELHDGVWKKSDTYIFLKRIGVAPVMDHVWSRILYFTDVITSWLRTNIPFYWTTTRDILGPYFSEVASAAAAMYKWMVEATLPLKIWFLDQTGQISIQMIDILKVVAFKSLEILDFFVDVAYEAAVWMRGVLGVVYLSLYQVASGQVSLADLQSALHRCAMMSYAYFSNLAQSIGNYIAPDQP